jgi:hypothetical protein
MIIRVLKQIDTTSLTSDAAKMECAKRGYRARCYSYVGAMNAHQLSTEPSEKTGRMRSSKSIFWTLK